MENSKVKKWNNIYIVFLIIVLIISNLISFRTGNKLYYLVNTNLNDKNAPVNSHIANWNFEVNIAY